MVKLFQSLAFYGLVMLSAWLPTSSFAYAPTVSAALYGAGAIGAYPGPTPLASCTAWATANKDANPGSTFTITSVNTANCAWYLTWSGSNFSYNTAMFYSAPASTCPAGGTLSGGSCTCTAPLTDTGSACSAPVDPNIAKCAAAKDGSDLITGFSSFPGFGSAFCPSDGGGASCGSKIDGGFAIIKNGVKTWTYEVKYTGTVCTPPPAPAQPGTQTTCKGSLGTVNGVTVCAPLTGSTPVEVAKTTTTTAPVASGQAPGSAGSTTSDSSSSCTGSKCSTTTTTTTTPAGGGTPTVTTKTEDIPKEDFCKDNPRSMACKEFTFGDISPEVVGSKTVNVGITKAADFGPVTGTCPAPKTVVIMGVTLTMPMTLLCDFAAAINPLLIGFAWLSASLTFFGFARK